MKATLSRRKLIVFVLLGLALIGGAMRLWSPNPSLARDLGTLLLVLWLPVIGNVIAYLVNRFRASRLPSTVFEPSRPFAAHRLAELTPSTEFSPDAAARLADERCCTLLIGSEGFTARLSRPLSNWLDSGQTQALEMEFLRPAVAGPRFPAGTAFRVLAGLDFAGDGRIVRVLP